MKKEKQLQYNVEEVLNMYLNGMYDYPDEYPKMTREECREYVTSEIYDMQSDGGGHTRYGKGICDDLRFLGNDVIYAVIDKYAEELGVLKQEQLDMDKMGRRLKEEGNVMNSQNNKWVRTDDTQWRKQITETTFHLVEVREFPDGYIYVSGIIDLDDYSDAEKSSVITGYYPSMEDFEESYPKEEINGILAECIFEQTQEMELTCFGPFDTEEKAEAEALNYICVQIEVEQARREDNER